MAYEGTDFDPATAVYATTMSSPAGNLAEDIIEKRFNQLQTEASSVVTLAKEKLDALKSLFGDPNNTDLWKNFTPLKFTDGTSVEIDISKITLPVIPEDLKKYTMDKTIADINGLTYTPEELTLETPSISVTGLVINPFTFTAPTLDTLTPPTADKFTYTEGTYDSDIYEKLLAALTEILETKGVPLGTEVEQAIWERAKDRIKEQWDLEYQATDKRFAAAGWDIPTGSHAAALSQVQTKNIAALAQVNHEQTINFAQMARDSWLKGIELSERLEEILRNSFEAKMTRLLTYSKELASYYLNVFNTQVQYSLAKSQYYQTTVAAYKAYVEAKKIESEGSLAIELAKADVAVKSNAIKMQKMELGYQAFKAKLDSINGLSGTTVALLGAKSSAYSEEVRAKIATVQVEVERGKALLSEKTARLALIAETNKANLQMILQKASLTIEGMEKLSGMYIQWMSSIFAALNVSVSASDSYNASLGVGYNYSHGRSIGLNISETHNWDETATAD